VLADALAVALGFGLVRFASVVGHALAPFVNRLDRRLPRPLAVPLTYLAFPLALGVLGWLVVSPLLDQALLLIAAAPQLLDQDRTIPDRFDRLGQGQLGAMLQSRLQGLHRRPAGGEQSADAVRDAQPESHPADPDPARPPDWWRDRRTLLEPGGDPRVGRAAGAHPPARGPGGAPPDRRGYRY